jgi:nicotinamidase-related amidase
MNTDIDAATTALVIIDLQKMVRALSGKMTPHSADTVIDNNVKLTKAFQEKNMPVFRVLVTMDLPLKPITDVSRDRAPITQEMLEPLPDLTGPLINITKRNWGAFYGTDLDMQLRRRNIQTIVLTGVATGTGVDTTAREAYQHGYQQFFVEDAMAALSEEEHTYTLKNIFSRIGRVRSTEQIIEAVTKQQ